MSIQVIEFANAGVPEAGLTPTWQSLQVVSDGSDFTPQPAITEIDNAGNADGGYKFTQPTITEPLRGIIDGGAALVDADRYVSVYITPDDYGMTDLLDAISQGKQVLDPDNDTLTIYRRDGVTVLTVFDLTKPLTAVDAYITRTPQ